MNKFALKLVPALKNACCRSMKVMQEGSNDCKNLKQIETGFYGNLII